MHAILARKDSCKAELSTRPLFSARSNDQTHHATAWLLPPVTCSRHPSCNGKTKEEAAKNGTSDTKGAWQ